MICIYKITNPKGKVYIGQTVEFEKRKQSYIKGWNKNQKKVYNSIAKYGWDAHTIEVIEECTSNVLNERERHYQELYNTIGANGLNLRATKSNDKSGYFSEETKAKMSEAGKKMIGKIKKLNENRFDWTGKKHSEETKQKIRESLLGKKKTAEHIAKLPQNQKGKFRAKYSNELKAKMVESSPLKRKVSQFSLDGKLLNTFISSNQAAKALGLKRGGNIRSCAMGAIHTAYGFKWKYVE